MYAIGKKEVEDRRLRDAIEINEEGSRVTQMNIGNVYDRIPKMPISGRIPISE